MLEATGWRMFLRLYQSPTKKHPHPQSLSRLQERQSGEGCLNDRVYNSQMELGINPSQHWSARPYDSHHVR